MDMRLEDKENEANLLPQGSPISRSFWESPSLEELARAQNVMPVTDVASLLGGWPGDAGDGFEEEIRRIRHTGVVGGNEYTVDWISLDDDGNPHIIGVSGPYGCYAGTIKELEDMGFERK